MIDMLASTGMRVGEMVLLNREDIDFNERECVVFGKGNTLHNGITGMCSYHFVLSGSARLFLCWVCEYSPNSNIYPVLDALFYV